MMKKQLAIMLWFLLGWQYTGFTESVYQIDPKKLQAQLNQPKPALPIKKSHYHNQSLYTHQHAQDTPINTSLTTGARFNDEYINRKIAQWALRQVNSSMPLITDPWVNQVIFNMTAKMNANVRSQSLLAVPIINNTAINAFAVPGGLIGLNTGTILSANQLDEVASVLAHEIAHLAQRHYEHSQDNKKKLIALQLGGLLAAIAAGKSGSGDAALAAIVGSQTASAEVMASHSREHEREADRIGMQILTQSGYDASAMPRFFGHLYKELTLYQSKDAYTPSFMQSHPFTAERLSEATARANQYPKVSMTSQKMHAKEFDKLVWRIKYINKQATLGDLKIAAKNSMGAKLALVSALADNGQTKDALTTLQEILQKNQQGFDNNDPLMCISRAYVFAADKQFYQAATTLQACQALYPERRDLNLHLADALIDAQKPEQAIIYLSPQVKNNQADIQAWTLLQRAYQNHAKTLTGKNASIATAYALQARSQIQLWQGEYMPALQSNAQASELVKQNQDVILQKILAKDKEEIINARDFKP